MEEYTIPGIKMRAPHERADPTSSTRVVRNPKSGVQAQSKRASNFSSQIRRVSRGFEKSDPDEKIENRR
jgi:hypothetical protein